MTSETSSKPPHVSRFSASAWITLGMVGAGAGQFALVWATNHYLTSAASSSVLLWNSASLAVGLFIASPTVALMIVRQGDARSKAGKAQADVQRASLAATIVAGVILPGVWLSGGASTGSLYGNVFGCVLLATSPAVQVFAATQRGTAASTNRWSIVALQLVADGVLRAVLAIVFGAVFGTALPMLVASWAPLVFAVLLVRQVSRLPILLRGSSFRELTEVRALLPLWITGLAEHAVLTLSPNVVAVFSADAELVEAFFTPDVLHSRSHQPRNGRADAAAGASVLGHLR